MEPMILNKRDNKFLIPLNRSQERSISKTKRINYVKKNKAKSVNHYLINKQEDKYKLNNKNYFPLVKNKTNNYLDRYSQKRSLSNNRKRGSPNNLNKYNLSNHPQFKKKKIQIKNIPNLKNDKNLIKIPFRGGIYNAKLGKAQSSYFSINNIKIPYSVNTTTGFAKKYNEDRVSIIVNVKKKNNWKEENWPKISYFSIFDGHGGNYTSNFLKDNLHKYIINSDFFIKDMEKAIKEGCQAAEDELLGLAKKNQMPKIDGSCGVFFFIIDQKMYFGNIGDSRAIISEKKGKIAKNITTDHKPDSPEEKKRIITNGGQVKKKSEGSTLSTDSKLYTLPSRVYPGGLSVSRAFGDFHAKDELMGGKKGVLIAEPEIFIYELQPGVVDFLFMGCDGVFDVFETEEIVEMIWKCSKEMRSNNKNRNGIESLERYGGIVNFLLKETMLKGGYDNLTCILIPFCSLL